MEELSYPGGVAGVFPETQAKEIKGINIVKASGLCVLTAASCWGCGGQEGIGKGQVINLQCACNPVIISTVETIFIFSDHLTRAICQCTNVLLPLLTRSMTPHVCATPGPVPALIPLTYIPSAHGQGVTAPQEHQGVAFMWPKGSWHSTTSTGCGYRLQWSEALGPCASWTLHLHPFTSQDNDGDAAPIK